VYLSNAPSLNLNAKQCLATTMPRHKKTRQKKKKAPRRWGRGKGRRSSKSTAARRVSTQKGGAFFLAALGLARVLVPLILRLGVRAGLAAGRKLISHAPKMVQRVAIDSAKQQAVQYALKHGRRLPGSSAVNFIKHDFRPNSHLENIKSLGMRAARNQRHVTRGVAARPSPKKKQ
jgi:hypothetical protein